MAPIAGAFSADQLRQFAQAAQQDPTIKGYRSFANLAEGKAVCVMEGPHKADSQYSILNSPPHVAVLPHPRTATGPSVAAPHATFCTLHSPFKGGVL